MTRQPLVIEITGFHLIWLRLQTPISCFRSGGRRKSSRAVYVDLLEPVARTDFIAAPVESSCVQTGKRASVLAHPRTFNQPAMPMIESPHIGKWIGRIYPLIDAINL